MFITQHLLSSKFGSFRKWQSCRLGRKVYSALPSTSYPGHQTSFPPSVSVDCSVKSKRKRTKSALGTRLPYLQTENETFKQNQSFQKWQHESGKNRIFAHGRDTSLDKIEKREDSRSNMRPPCN